jgi:hypothetical protein
MSLFRPSQAYRSELDIRFADGEVPPWIRPLVEGRTPNSFAWLVVMARRAGKTWLARGIVHARPEGSTYQVDLRSAESALRQLRLGCLIGRRTTPPLGEGDVLLIDEPALARPGERGVEPAVLAAGLSTVATTGAVPVVFATPAEHDLLVPFLGADAPKDVLRPPALSAAFLKAGRRTSGVVGGELAGVVPKPRV